VTWALRTFGAVDVARASRRSTDCRFAAGAGTPDLEVTKVADRDAVAAGDRVRYTVTVTNTGSSDATRVVVDDREIDGRVRILSASPSQGRCEVPGSAARLRAFCTLGTIGPGDRATILVVGEARVPGRAENRASVVSFPVDDDPSDNIARAAVRVTAGAVSGAGGGAPPFTG
jgi:uncharacterized repeat protein (TIGR01451 family)